MRLYLLDLGLLTFDLHLLPADCVVLLLDLRRQVAILRSEALKGRLDRGQLSTEALLLLVHVLTVELHLALERLQLQTEVRTLHTTHTQIYITDSEHMMIFQLATLTLRLQ